MGQDGDRDRPYPALGIGDRVMNIRRSPDLDDLDREIRDHIEEETLDNIARGMSEADARADAIRKFGNVARVKEDVRAVWIPLWLDQLRQDARDAARTL